MDFFFLLLSVVRIKIAIRSSIKRLGIRAVIGPSSRRVKILQGNDVWKCELSCHVNSSRYECVEEGTHWSQKLDLVLGWLRSSAGCVVWWLSFRINELVGISNTDCGCHFLTCPYLNNNIWDQGKILILEYLLCLNANLAFAESQGRNGNILRSWSFGGIIWWHK